MPRLTEVEKTRPITLLENGWSLQAVADSLQVSKSCIFKIKQKWLELGNVAYVHGGGRRKVSTVEQDIQLLDHLRQHPLDTVVAACHLTRFPWIVADSKTTDTWFRVE